MALSYKNYFIDRVNTDDFLQRGNMPFVTFLIGHSEEVEKISDVRVFVVISTICASYIAEQSTPSYRFFGC